MTEDFRTGKVTLKKVRQQLELQGYRCAISGLKLFPVGSSGDHIHPLKYGGTHDMSNFQILAYDINQMKRTHTYESFVALCMLVVERALDSGNQIIDNTPLRIEDFPDATWEDWDHHLRRIVKYLNVINWKHNTPWAGSLDRMARSWNQRQVLLEGSCED